MKPGDRVLHNDRSSDRLADNVLSGEVLVISAVDDEKKGLLFTTGTVGHIDNYILVEDAINAINERMEEFQSRLEALELLKYDSALEYLDRINCRIDTSDTTIEKLLKLEDIMKPYGEKVWIHNADDEIGVCSFPPGGMAGKDIKKVKMLGFSLHNESITIF